MSSLSVATKGKRSLLTSMIAIHRILSTLMQKHSTCPGLRTKKFVDFATGRVVSVRFNVITFVFKGYERGTSTT